MQDNTVIFILAMVLMLGWFGTTAYSTYAKHRAEIARIESNAEDYRRSLEELGKANVAAAKVCSEALARAIERLAEREER